MSPKKFLLLNKIRLVNMKATVRVTLTVVLNNNTIDFAINMFTVYNRQLSTKLLKKFIYYLNSINAVCRLRQTALEVLFMRIHY